MLNLYGENFLIIRPFIKWNGLPHEVVSFSSLKDSETDNYLSEIL